MALRLMSGAGGHLVLPDRASLLVGAANGGNLVVLPPRPVWERSELTSEELTHWSWLVAAAGRAMIDTLPQLANGCVNYWEAGNWALNDAADPPGRKRARDHRSVHLHLLGRAPASTDPAWRWGESPRFPDYAERLTWAEGYERLSAAECRGIVAAATMRLREVHRVAETWLAAGGVCAACGHPFVPSPGARECEECRG